ncbi:hypothetical protein HanPSC8_Chr10g0431951 [Helianthus annuus]|nr:hypothetical protein HanPSC8_Chr10g0431951 [Helianthus annuus]
MSLYVKPKFPTHTPQDSLKGGAYSYRIGDLISLRSLISLSSLRSLISFTRLMSI